MTRLAAGLALALAFSAGTAPSASALPAAPLPPAAAAPLATGSPPGTGSSDAAPGLLRIEYYCSPGFEPSYGGTCLAVPPRAEIELFVDQPLYAVETTRVVRHHRRRYGLRERY